MSKSVLTVGDIPVSYVDATGMTVLDYVGFSVSTAVLVGYHVWHEYATHSKLHSSVTSHVEFSRMSWTKNIYYDYKNRVTTIQSFRSALGIIRFYLSLILFAVLTIGRAAVSLNWWAALRGPIPLVAARTIVPFTIFMVSAAQFLLCLQTLYYLHFHTQVEDLDHAEREQFGIADVATDVTEQRIKACSAVLAMQSNIHFRIAWRTMVYGTVECEPCAAHGGVGLVDGEFVRQRLSVFLVVGDCT